MLVLPLALIASFTASTDRLGGSEASPEVLPAAGKRSGWQATHTTRWVRLETPVCTEVTVEARFERGSGHVVVVKPGELESWDGVRDGTTPYRWEQITAHDGRRAFTVQSRGPTLDLGLRVRDYTTVSLAWSGVPCPAIAASTGELPQFLQALVDAPKRVRGNLRLAFEKAGLELEEFGDPEDPLGVTTTVELGEYGATLEVELNGESARVLIDVPDGATPGDIAALHKASLATLARLGLPGLEYRDVDQQRWYVDGPGVRAWLKLGPDEVQWTLLLRARRP